MTAKSRTAWTLAVTSAALFMASLDNLVVTTALPSIREHLHASLQGLQWTVNAYTLTFAVLLLTGATPRRAVRPPPDVRHRPGRVHRWVGGRRARARHRLAHRRTGRAGRRGGHRRPADPHPAVRGGAPAAPRHGPGRLGRRRRPGHRYRPAGRRRRHRGRVVAVDLLAQRADRHRAAAHRPGPADREPRAGDQPGPARRGAGQPGPVRHRATAWSAATTTAGPAPPYWRPS